MLLLNLKIVFFNSFPKCFFILKFRPETSKYFVLNETWFMKVSEGADSDLS